MANMSLDKMVGLITTVSQTTRLSAESIGESLKTVFARMQNIKAQKFIDDETGEELNDVEKVLSKLGIRLRDNEHSWRSLEGVLDEIGSKWENFNNIEQSAIVTAIAGKIARTYGDIWSYVNNLEPSYIGRSPTGNRENTEITSPF